MSWRATAHAKQITGVSRSAKLLMLVLADYVDDETGFAWPSVARIARDALLSERRTRDLLHELERNGLLHIEQHVGRRNTNRYRFTENMQPLQGNLFTETISVLNPAPENRQSAVGKPAIATAPEPTVPEPTDQEPPLESGATATTAREADGFGEAESGLVGSTAAWAAVESLIGLVPPILEPRIDAAIARFGGLWVHTACSRAAEANVRRWDYVSAILERWAVDGFDSPRPAPAPRTPGRTPGRRPNLGAGHQAAASPYPDRVAEWGAAVPASLRRAVQS